MASNTLQSFNHEHFGQIRTIEHDGTVLFCGRDVATALGYANTNDALARHCKGVVNHYPLQTPGGTQHARFITEGDLYRLIAASKLPAAARFESWVFDEVLPSIRRHGVYAIDELLANDEFLERAIATLRAERTKRLAAEQALAEAKPKLTYYDQVLKATRAVAISRIAKDYGMSAQEFNQLLADLHVQYKRDGQWLLYAEHAGHGYTKSETGTAKNGYLWMHTKWTQKGRLFIYDLLKNSCGLLPIIEREEHEREGRGE
ncbi:BRO family protein [Corynebacterium poyangense]|uniref:BRO family protein n=1 Tax=Corynebacterium poyangense TaxID=2684405 RepID=A0A7H0SRI6_9CORY|nr:phage antirepressor [Corynebacterium poyangense]QNQ91161.1 BRO family protein [Corynebacterium poyangense]